MRKSQQISKLQEDLQSAATRIEASEIHNRRDNLLITGLPISSYADAVESDAGSKTSQALEQSVLQLFNQKLGLPIKSTDISTTHRLKKSCPSDPHPATTFVRFTNRKAREAVYSARRLLRRSATPIFMNEDLNKPTAELFHEARQLVLKKIIHSAWISSNTPLLILQYFFGIITFTFFLLRMLPYVVKLFLCGCSLAVALLLLHRVCTIPLWEQG